MEPVTEEEAHEMRAILEQLYGPQVQGWTITLATYDVFGKLLIESKQCTKAMHLVPRPYDFSAPLKWAQKQVRNALRRYFTTPEGKHYLVCLRTAALKMKTLFWEAQFVAK
jgi:hypothetical protein